MGFEASVQIINNFSGINDSVSLALRNSLNVAAERGMALAVDRSPWDQGTLAGAHTVKRASNADDGAAIIVDTPYATRLHEHPEYNFSTDSNPNAQGKWVENAIVENKAELGEIVAEEIRRTL